jgi:LCP family protein required for cell wall assembly
VNSGRKIYLPGWLKLLLALAIIGTVATITAFAYLSVEAYMNRPFNPVASAAEAVDDVQLQPMPQVGDIAAPSVPAGAPTPTLIPTSEAAAESARINVLVMGIDRRPGQSFISRTDTMMLVSVDPDNEKVSVLSIPRDLYVVLPGRGRDRINTAFVYGSEGDNPAGGALLAMQTVEYNLGVPIDHYLLIDFGAVTRAVDTIGGIDIIVPYEIYDPTFPDMDYGVEPLYIPAGLQHMDGQTALKYARTRHQDNDFERARRQQQVIMAFRSKLMAMGLPELLLQAPQLYDRVDEGIKTDLSLAQIVELGRLAADIPEENIRREVLDVNYVSSYRTEAGASVLVPINEKIGPLIQELFYE